MKIISNYSKDTKTVKNISGSYEWWYFDAQSSNGFKFVVIFYEGNPFSRNYILSQKKSSNVKAEEYPAISISVYKGDEPIYYSFREVDVEDAMFSIDQPMGRVEKNRFEGHRQQTRLEYKIILDQQLSNGDSILAEVRFTSDQVVQPFNNSTGKHEEPHEWNLVMPSGFVDGTIKISGYHEEVIHFNGLGYHDHNVGFEPLKDSFTEWYWGRYHLDELTFVYYLMNKEGKWQKKAWLIDKSGKVKKCDKVEISNYGFSIFGLKTGRAIKAHVNGTEIYLQLDEILDSGPFYQRFGGRLIFKSNNRVLESRGISEYIKPARIYSRMYWPLVDMRISYPGEEHWVQRSPVLYRWTW